MYSYKAILKQYWELIAAQITPSVQIQNLDSVRALLRCLLIPLHKKTVAVRDVFYDIEIDKRLDNIYNILHICMRGEALPHNANYVVHSVNDMQHNANYVVFLFF